MIKSMFNVHKLIIDELPYKQCSITHDLGHKKEVYEIFLHHLYRNFSSLLYKEICNLLKQSDMTMGEIADSLHFSDQSALSNFFKLRSGMSPLAYRNQ